MTGATELCDLSATDLGAKLRSGEVSAQAILESALRRIELVEERTQAFLAITADLARQQAASGLAEVPESGFVPPPAPGKAVGPTGRRRTSAPLVEIARAATQQEAMDGLERWRARHHSYAQDRNSRSPGSGRWVRALRAPPEAQGPCELRRRAPPFARPG